MASACATSLLAALICIQLVQENRFERRFTAQVLVVVSIVSGSVHDDQAGGSVGLFGADLGYLTLKPGGVIARDAGRAVDLRQHRGPGLGTRLARGKPVGIRLLDHRVIVQGVLEDALQVLGAGGAGQRE